ncbi:DUF2213 domain-containing protein (plasmid) [Vibrio harveyi]|uniref:DUF2213 domain-containing protein n=1 Tax=Vibrio harveyi TaxID=669 RepID=UPI00234DA766|nr:DUF2213 domain-containing protein [Vibrio harveyi]WCP84215.1 DUF2213 domain-containing protein [Vibrio harveyi]
MVRKTISCDVQTTRSYTPQGFLKVSILAGKVGVQRYSCDELDVPDIHGTGFVNVARLPEEVFSQKSLDSLEFIDLTDNHPPEREVTSDNYKTRTTGVVTSKGRKHEDGKHIVVDALIKDKATIRAVENNKKQVSLGYEHDIIRRSGTLDGENYDYVQTDIFHNHLAIVHRGRAKTATILDSENLSMTEEEIAAMQAENERLKESNTKLSNDAESAELERTIDRARVIDSSYDPKGKTHEQVKRDLLGDKVSNDHDMSIVNYAFNDLFKTCSNPDNRQHRPIQIKARSNDADMNDEQKRISEDADKAKSEYMKGLQEGY